MKRREAFKKLGLLSLVGMSGMALMSCGNDKKEEVATATATATAAAVIPKNISERDKLIINRERNTFVDAQNPTKAELKHTPEISFGDADEKGNIMVKITIGQQGIIHPATEGHWIDYLKVFVNDKENIAINFTNGGVRAFGDFYLVLKKGDTVKAESGCNIHGIWENSVVY